MAVMVWVFDALLGLGLLGLALAIVRSHNLYQAVVMYMVFGLLAALAWTRLYATDIALAEAAIGAGITGALFLSTIGRLKAMDEARSAAKDEGARDSA